MDDLLTPSIEKDSAGKPLYSARATFFVAFLIGPFGLLLFAALNSSTLGRLKKDARFYIALIALFTAAYAYALYVYGDFTSLKNLAASMRSDRLLHYVPRIGAVLLWALYYQMHKKHFRAMEMFGVKPRSPWAAVVLAIVVDLALKGALLWGVWAAASAA
ncbi:MAG: hypothetical protein OEV59_02285 [Deltaproteobacteria bacterium]|nr:hypothetical protein [Deltaproteobacteria bacterium]